MMKGLKKNPLPPGEGRVRGCFLSLRTYLPSPQPSPGGRGGVVLAFMVALSLSACWTSDILAPEFRYRQGEGAGTTGIHTVSAGDSVWSLAERYRLVMRDIIVVNNLDAPYQLAPGQRIRLPPPREYKVRSGDNIYSVSRLFNVSTTQVAQLNTLSSPFILKTGQVLKLPVVADRPVMAESVSLSASGIDMGMSLPASRMAGAIEKEELAPPSVKGEAIPAPAAPVANVSLSSRVPDATPPRSGSNFLRPVLGKVVSSYGPKPGGEHNDGVNIAAPRNTPVRAAENGVVVYVGNDLKGYGNMILIRHADRWMTAYAHLDKTLVQKGGSVRAGDTIGTVGTTGSVSEPQLHFEIRRGTDALNPEKYM